MLRAPSAVCVWQQSSAENMLLNTYKRTYTDDSLRQAACACCAIGRSAGRYSNSAALPQRPTALPVLPAEPPCGMRRGLLCGQPAL